MIDKDVAAEPVDGIGNRLGALALVLTDRAGEAVARASGCSESAAACLSAIHHFLDDPTIELLAQVVGLSHSGTVRLVDRLERDGRVLRRPGADRRATVISLTDAGRQTARELASARTQVLGNALQTLTSDEQRVLDSLVGRVLVAMMREPGANGWMCRLCDTHGCGRAAGECPVANEAVARYAIDLAATSR